MSVWQNFFFPPCSSKLQWFATIGQLSCRDGRQAYRSVTNQAEKLQKEHLSPFFLCSRSPGPLRGLKSSEHNTHLHWFLSSVEKLPYLLASVLVQNPLIIISGFARYVSEIDQRLRSQWDQSPLSRGALQSWLNTFYNYHSGSITWWDLNQNLPQRIIKEKNKGWAKMSSANLTFIHGSNLFNDFFFFHVDNWPHERRR